MNIKREMKFADECINNHMILSDDPDDIKEIMFDYVTGVIDRYNKYLLKNGYTDSDIVTEFNLDEWLKENL